MPELPEVETIVRSLAPRVVGRRIVRARFASPLVFRGDPDAGARLLQGLRVESLARRGKFIVFELAGDVRLTVHLGMTGKLLWNAEPGPYARAVFELDKGRVVYDDIRQFGRIEIGHEIPGRVARLGPEPLEIGEREFASALKSRRGRIKPLLLNQFFLRGMGNIYVDEALFRAGIHPLAQASRLSPKRVHRLYEAIQETLREAIATGGSSISDYVDAEGRPGSFQDRHRVYGKEGVPCPACGTPIRRTVIAQRGTHYCPKCQRV